MLYNSIITEDSGCALCGSSRFNGLLFGGWCGCILFSSIIVHNVATITVVWHLKDLGGRRFPVQRLAW